MVRFHEFGLGFVAGGALMISDYDHFRATALFAGFIGMLAYNHFFSRDRP